VKPLVISALAFVLVLGGALLGMYFRKVVSADHLRDDVKDMVRLSMGLIGTIAALVLGLLIASAKSSYDTRVTQFKQITANVILLDLLLEQYGPDAQNLRTMLRLGVPIMVERITNEGRSGAPAPYETTSEAQRFVARVEELKPNSESQRSVQTRIINAIVQLTQSRLALFTQAHDSIPAPFLAVLIFWLAVIFASFGVFVRPVPIVVITFVVGAMSVSGALFLILEMDQPFAGLFQISTETLTSALAPLGN
jgi:hypothetical protein